MVPPTWGDADVALFYEDLRKVVEKFGPFPGDERAYDHTDWKEHGNHDGRNRLTFDEEIDWVSDLAFLAAVSARNVSAVLVEERLDEMTLKSYAAANVGIPDCVGVMIQSVLNALAECAQMKIGRQECADKILDIIVPVQASRIHDRLRSLQLVPPKGRSKSAFTPTLIELIEKTAFRNLRDGASEEILRLKTSIRQLGDLYTTILSQGASIPTADEKNLFKTIAKQANKVTGILGTRTLEKALEERQPRVANSDALRKLVRQVDKLGRYWSASKSLSCLARSKRSSFQRFTFKAVPPYTRNNKKRFVHAEIQLLVYASLNQLQSRPRSIGVSKAACYLCDLFISNHGKYFVSGTHGTLFGKWRFPHINELNPEPNDDTINGFRSALQSMKLELHRLLKTQRASSMNSRPSPMQSRVFYCGRSPATFSDSSLSKIAPLDQERIGARLTEAQSHQSIHRQDSGYQTAMAKSSPTPSLATELDNVVISEEANRTAELSGDPEDSPVIENEQPTGDSVSPKNPSRTSLESTSSTIKFTPSTIVESSHVITKRTPARFAINSLCLDVMMKDHDVPNHETTARVQHLRNQQDIIALLGLQSQSQVIDQRGLLAGEECVLPVPKTDSGRSICLLLGQDPASDEAMCLELKVRDIKNAFV